MGFIDNIADGNFKTTDNGVVLFYPQGIWGKGYIVPNVEKRQELRRAVKKLHFFTLVVVIPVLAIVFPILKALSSPFGIIVSTYLAMGFVLTVAEYFFRKQLAQGLTAVSEKLTTWETMQHFAKSQSIELILLLEAGSLLFTAGSTWAMLNRHLVWYLRLNGVLGTLFFGFCSLIAGYMIVVKNKK